MVLATFVFTMPFLHFGLWDLLFRLCSFCFRGVLLLGNLGTGCTWENPPGYEGKDNSGLDHSPGRICREPCHPLSSSPVLDSGYALRPCAVRCYACRPCAACRYAWQPSCFLLCILSLWWSKLHLPLARKLQDGPLRQGVDALVVDLCSGQDLSWWPT